MSDQTTAAPTTEPHDLGPGLVEYYSSQADLMLSQYKNINHLLGPTHDWTHPGDFCEILFRDFLRKFLPPSLSADKGFFYGRATLDGKDTHCPEIDILIHDSQQYRPIFRMGDFVIVQPQAVVGMIQVKRTLSDKPVRVGVRNVVMAKQHLLNVLWKEKPNEWLDYSSPPRVFTAVVGFEDEIVNPASFYGRLLLKWAVKQRAYDRPNMMETSMYVLPTFIASLEKQFVFQVDGNLYYIYDSFTDKANTCVQALLSNLYHVIGKETYKTLPLSFPAMKPQHAFHVLEVAGIVGNPDGSISLTLNDGRKGTFKKEAEGDWPAHYTCDAEGHFSLQHHMYWWGPLYIKRGSVVERYELVPPWEKAVSVLKRKRRQPG